MSFELKQCLLEGRFENETTHISRQIVRKIKVIYKNKLKKKNVFKLKSDIENVDAIFVVVTSSLKPGKAPVLSGAYGQHTNDGKKSILINIDVSEDWHDDQTSMFDDMELLIPELKSIIRHELEHTAQQGWDIEYEHGRKTLKQAEAYLLDKGEVAAFVSGIYKQAKTARVPASYFLNKKFDSVRHQMKEFDIDPVLTDEMIERVKKVWLAYGRKRFPKAYF